MHKKKRPILYAFSRHVIPRPPDWGEHICIAGSFFPKVDPTWQPSKPLAAFLDDGPPPVYVGFGSIRSEKGKVMRSKTVKALQQMNKRILVATHDPEPSWQQDSNLFVLDYAPHTWLFPRMAAVIHHGGAGTTAAGLHAGVPSLIMPFSNDQPMWAKRVCELSTGTSFRPDHKPSEPKLHHAITQLFDTTIVHKAQEIGKRMQAEQGVDNAVAWLRAQSLV